MNGRRISRQLRGATQPSAPPGASRVLIVQYSSNRDGSTISGLMLADGLREAGWETHVAFAAPGPLVDKYRADGHQTYIARHENWLRSARYRTFLANAGREVARASAMSALIRRVQPQAVYINTVASAAGAAAAWRNGAPTVWHIRELFSDVGGEMKVPPLCKGLARRVVRGAATKVVVNSKSVAENMLGKWGIRNAAVVPNAVEAGFFSYDQSPPEARARLGLPLNGVVVGVPGTLRPMKGHTFFFNAMARLAALGVHATLAVTGHGQPAFREELEAAAADLGLGRRVVFLGSIEAMPAFYRACDVVCVPSVAEPFGRTVIEAFAVGTPVVASAVGGIRETIKDGATGFLVPYGDADGMARRVRQLCRDGELRGRLTDAAKAEAVSSYGRAAYVERLESILRSSMEVHGRRWRASA